MSRPELVPERETDALEQIGKLADTLSAKADELRKLVDEEREKRERRGA